MFIVITWSKMLGPKMIIIIKGHFHKSYLIKRLLPYIEFWPCVLISATKTSTYIVFQNRFRMTLIRRELIRSVTTRDKQTKVISQLMNLIPLLRYCIHINFRIEIRLWLRFKSFFSTISFFRQKNGRTITRSSDRSYNLCRNS